MARVAFVVTTCHEFEGIKAVSATLKQHGHKTDCFITSEEVDFGQAVLDFQPDVLGVYATTGQEKWTYPYIDHWRRELSHLKVVMGGPHPSFDNDVLLDEEYVDATVKGEAEGALLDLVNAWRVGHQRAFERGGSDGVHVQQRRPADDDARQPVGRAPSRD